MSLVNIVMSIGSVLNNVWQVILWQTYYATRSRRTINILILWRVTLGLTHPTKNSHLMVTQQKRLQQQP